MVAAGRREAQLESDQASVDANRIALAGVREEERVGQRTLLDVLNAEQELLNSEVNLVTTKRNLVVASYAVLSTIGRLNAQELGMAGLVYDPEAHYNEVRRKWFDINITHGDGRREVFLAAARREPPQIRRNSARSAAVVRRLTTDARCRRTGEIPLLERAASAIETPYRCYSLRACCGGAAEVPYGCGGV